MTHIRPSFVWPLGNVKVQRRREGGTGRSTVPQEPKAQGVQAHRPMEGRDPPVKVSRKRAKKESTTPRIQDRKTPSQGPFLP